jgi:hypothetical protein
MVNAVLLARSEEEIAESVAQEDRVLKRRALLLVMCLKSTLTLRTFLYPAGALLVAILISAKWHVEMGRPGAIFLMCGLVIFLVLNALETAVMASARVASRLSEIPEEEWFTVAGVKQLSQRSLPVRISFVDHFGKTYEYTAYKLPKYWDREFDSLKESVVSYLKPQWEPYLEPIRRQKLYTEMAKK